MSDRMKKPPSPAHPPGRAEPAAHSTNDVDAFLEKAARTPVTRSAGRRGRLLFALDATMSRQPTWDRASHLQAEMFQETAAIGGLDVQLAYFRGFGEFHVSPWVSEAKALLAQMSGIQCRGGHTQIKRVLRHTLKETQHTPVQALVYIGDCFEENIDDVCALAGQLALCHVPAFMFHEGSEAGAEQAFREIARLTGGAYCPFDATSVNRLRALLGAVAVYAAGGRVALEAYGARHGSAVRQLTRQIR